MARHRGRKKVSFKQKYSSYSNEKERKAYGDGYSDGITKSQEIIKGGN